MWLALVGVSNGRVLVDVDVDVSSVLVLRYFIELPLRGTQIAFDFFLFEIIRNSFESLHSFLECN